MKFYAHHLGDYLRDTMHLSILEDGAYRRLIDAYYNREAPIPQSLSTVYRLVRAESKQERAAVQTVLKEFFVPVRDGWKHERCDEEIEKARIRIEVARHNGLKGGRPPNPDVTQQEPTGLSVGSIPLTQQKAIQYPISNLQEEEKNQSDQKVVLQRGKEIKNFVKVTANRMRA